MRDGLTGHPGNELVVKLVPGASIARYAGVVAAARRARVANDSAQVVAVDFGRAV